MTSQTVRPITPKSAGANPLILVPCLAPAGCEKQSYLLARALKQRGMLPGVIVWNLTDQDYYREHIEEMGIPFFIAPQDQGRWAKLRWLHSLVRMVRPRVLHSMAFYLNSVAAFASHMTPTIAIGAIRGDYQFEADQGYIHYAINRRWPKTIVANSERAWRAAVADRSIFRPRKALMVSNGLDLNLYKVRIHGGLTTPQILGVGNLHREKGWDRLLRSVARLQSNRPELLFKVQIAGEGKERSNLQQLVKRSGLEQRVTFLGRRLDIPDLLFQSDIFVMASDSEGTPNAIMEAMAAGLPVVSTDVGDVSRLVEDGINGYVIPLHSGAEHLMTSALIKLLGNPALRAHMGAQSRERSAEFGLDELAQRVLEAYRRAGWEQN